MGYRKAKSGSFQAIRSFDRTVSTPPYVISDSALLPDDDWGRCRWLPATVLEASG